MASATKTPPTPTFAQRANETLVDVLTLFSNVGFGVSLLAIWAFLTLIGVIVDQGKPPSFYLTNYTPPLARLVLRLHLDNVYHSTVYVALIGLIAAAVIIVSFRRVIPSRMPPLRAVKIEMIPLNASIEVEGSESDVRARVERFFAERGWLVRKRDFSGVEWTFADKHNWARRGVLVAHVGFLVIAAGTTIYWALGYSGETAIVSGTSVKIPRNGATIALDKFYYRIDPIQTKSGTVYQPVDYVSDVHVTDREGRTTVRRLRVNAPIDVDGTLFYQASYGFTVDFAVTHAGVPVAGPNPSGLREGEAFSVGQTALAVQYARFAPTIDRATGAVSPDPRVHDPGVVLAVFNGDQPSGQVLVPFGQSVDLGSGYRVTPVRWRLYSGIQYRYDPGIPLVGLGALILTAGLCISFYFLPARMFVRVDGAGRSWSVGLAATSVKGYELFEEQFRDLVRALETTTQGTVKPRIAPSVTSAAASGASGA